MTSIRTAITSLADMFAYPLRHSHYLELVNPLWTEHVLKARVAQRVGEHVGQAGDGSAN